jgi:hypothetical protein
MKISKTIKQKTGIDVAHWEIRRVTLDIANSSAIVMVEGYLSEEVMSLGGDSIVVKTVEVQVAPDKMAELLDTLAQKIENKLS